MKKILIAISLFAATTHEAFAVPRKDRLECELPDGSKFHSSAKYDWEPLSNVFPVSERLDQEPFSVAFYPAKSRRKIALPESVFFRSMEPIARQTTSAAVFVCSTAYLTQAAYFCRWLKLPDHPFIARAVRVNGKKMNAKFPSIPH